MNTNRTNADIVTDLNFWAAACEDSDMAVSRDLHEAAAALVAADERLEKLKPYAEHLDDCGVMEWQATLDAICTCGLAELMAQAESEGE